MYFEIDKAAAAAVVVAAAAATSVVIVMLMLTGLSRDTLTHWLLGCSAGWLAGLPCVW